MERDLGAFHPPHHISPLVLTSLRIVSKPNSLKTGMRPQVVDVPMRSYGLLLVVGDPSTQASWTQRTPDVNVIPVLKQHRSQAPDLNVGIARTGEDQRICPGLWFNGHLT